MASNFIGKYQPVYINDVLIEFFTKEPWRFGVLNIRDIFASLDRHEYPEIYYLIDSLPVLNQGYALKRSLVRLMQIYCLINLHAQIRDVERLFARIPPDSYMDHIFGGSKPAYYYLNPNTSERIPMEYAIQKRLIYHPLNTYDVFRIPRHQWNLSQIFQMIDLNSIEISRFDVEEAMVHHVSNPVIQDSLKKESKIIEESFNQLKAIYPLPNDIQEFLEKNYNNFFGVKEPGYD